ncbi:MAG: Arylsulfatase [Verrucomicrobia subdivision 3 bacterium]|nr:Arylsulfatase [Limisphaerales bacterium]MCS1414711.1 Arylsulfatase [Limisphaerales bacterium]
MAAQLPNIVLLIADDLSYEELSRQGNPEIPTPHTNSLAKQRIRFTQDYEPECSANGTSDGTAKYNPIRRGFDEFFGFLHEGHYFIPPPYQGATPRLR